MKRLLRAALSCLPRIDRRRPKVESEARVSWNGRPVAEIAPKNPKHHLFDTLNITQDGNADCISK